MSSSGETRQLWVRVLKLPWQKGRRIWGWRLKDIGPSSADLLADRLLQNGDPDPEAVRIGRPSHGVGGEESPHVDDVCGHQGGLRRHSRLPQAEAPGPIIRSSTFLNCARPLRKDKSTTAGGRLDAGGPQGHHRHPTEAYWEVIVFGDVRPNKNKYIVHTWHRTARIEDGKIAEVVYGHSYPAFPPARQDPKPEEFYRALLEFAQYWQRLLHDFSAASLPQHDWIDLSKHSVRQRIDDSAGRAFIRSTAQSIATMPVRNTTVFRTSSPAPSTPTWSGGVRIPRGSSSITTFTEYVDSQRHDRHARAGDRAVWHDSVASGAVFQLQRRLPGCFETQGKNRSDGKVAGGHARRESSSCRKTDPGYGLIRGWSESDSCLSETPSLYWQPYYANSAFAARGFKDLPGLDAIGPRQLGAWYGNAG